MNKRIQYNKENRDFDAYLEGQYIGSFSTPHDAEVELDRLAYEQLRRGA